MVVGKISLENAMARMSNGEYYAMFTYNDGETLPEQYVPYEGLTSDEGTLFATINPAININYICINSKIQKVTRLGRPDGSILYLLGTGARKSVFG